jgi:DNA-binding LacI/PurR family transcriptional regulator
MALEQQNEMTAILAADDEVALGALQALNERSLAVPRQVSIIGFNDDDYAAFTVPPLTTVKIDPHSLGRELISLLYRKSNDAPRKPVSVKLPTVLVKRGSCRPLSAI